MTKIVIFPALTPPSTTRIDSLSLIQFVSLRLLKDNLQDSQFSARYQHLLAALLCCVGRGLREEFDRQCWLVSVLAKVAHKVRDSTPSSRQVGRTEKSKELQFTVIENRKTKDTQKQEPKAEFFLALLLKVT